MKNRKNVSLRVKVLSAFVLIATLIMLAYILFTSLFWWTYLKSSNERQILGTYQELQFLVENGQTSEADIHRALRNVRSEMGISVAIQGDTDWDFTVATRNMMSPREREFLTGRLQENFLNPAQTDLKIIQRTSEYTLQTVKLPGLQGETQRYYECYGYMRDKNGNNKKFIISMPLEGYYRVSNDSIQYTLSLSMFVLLLGALLIFFLASRITKPITQLTEISKKMTDLDFSTRYTGGKTDEVGILGQNMNILSDKLQVTIEELKVANEKLQEDLREKEKIDEMRREFLSNVSHELKTPIALIQGYAEGLKDLQDSPEEMEYYIDVITDESDKMNHLVKILTTLTQLEFGEMEMEIRPFDICEMVEGIVKANGRKLEEKNASVQVITAGKTMVLGDEYAIEEVISNYLTNAMNHLKAPNEILFTVEKKEHVARVTVHNTGEPIPEEEQEKVWIKFYKVDKARTRAYGGSGIGLSIVKAIMEAHKGGYGVYNTESGVSFWFELRLEDENAGNYGGMGEGAEA